MIIACATCGREMQCTKIGMILHSHSGAYWADLYQCMKCGNKVAISEERRRAEPEDIITSVYDVKMEGVQ